MTPLEFSEKYVTTPMDDYVCLVHDPRESSPVGQTYTIEYLGNVVDGVPIKYLNVDIELIKDITMRLLEDGQPVWMGCDTDKQMHRDLGLWDAELFDYSGVYGADFSLDKASRLDYHQTRMTHAMMFTGVDVVDGKPRRCICLPVSHPIQSGGADLHHRVSGERGGRRAHQVFERRH